MIISVVIPIYNEIDNLQELHAQLTSVLPDLTADYEILFCNDGSSDGSEERLNLLAESDSHVKVIHLRRNFGQTAALMAGFNNARGDCVIAMDGDLQNDPTDIPRMVEKLNAGFDVVSGWRVNRKEGWSRRIPSKLANWLISRITGVALHDYGCTLKAYRGDVLRDVRLYGEMHRFIPAHIAWTGGKITEIPVSHHARRHGSSKYGFDRVSRVLLDLIVVSFLGGGLDRPIQFFGKAGIYSIVLAGLFAVWALYLKFIEGLSFIQTPLPIMVTLFFLVALIFVMMGLLAEIQVRIYFESRNRFPYVIRETRNIVPADGEGPQENRAGPVTG